MNTAMARWDAGGNLLVTGLLQGLAHEVLNPPGFQQGFQVQGGDLCVGTAQFPGIHSVWQEIPDFHPAALRVECKAPFSQVRTASFGNHQSAHGLAAANINRPASEAWWTAYGDAQLNALT